MKKFISTSPYQPKPGPDPNNPEKINEGLKKGIYSAADNQLLSYDTLTSFPIIPTINGYVEKGEQIEVITIVSEYENAEYNYELLKDELEALSKKKGFKYTLKEIRVPYNSSLKIQFKIFTSLISHTADNDKLFCDITYGTKVMNQILTMGINYGYSIHKDVTIGCIVYGEYDHNSKTLKIYDITSLTYLNEIVKILADNKVSDPEKKIKAFLNWED